MTALWVVALLAITACAFCWIASVITSDTSWVDRLWSIVPVPYVWVFAGFAGLADVRLNVMALLVTLWGARLTFNFARKGGYSGVEDYRWAVVRSHIPPAAFPLFNLFFIVVYQNLLLVLITLPALTALENPRPFGMLDGIATGLFLVFLAGETIADQQQWNFHQWKKRETAAGRQPQARFLTTGLFRLSSENVGSRALVSARHCASGEGRLTSLRT